MMMRFGLTVSMAILALSAGIAHADAPKGFYRTLPNAGRWAQKYGLKVGYLRELLLQRAARTSPSFSKLLQEIQRRLNGSNGKLRGCWTKARLALANLAVSAVRKPQLRLSSALRPAVDAFQRAMASGDWTSVATAIEAAQWRMRRSFDEFQKRIEWSVQWLKQPCGAARAEGAPRSMPLMANGRR
jgi:hypothetical protein